LKAAKPRDSFIGKYDMVSERVATCSSCGAPTNLLYDCRDFLPVKFAYFCSETCRNEREEKANENLLAD
jgi:hypothetical protein